ncbi:MAG: IPExxxVDY family protein [Flavobacteriales bacterium]|nr:IPExxxVDY family protein [Flavobacteriales bacterium]
MSAKLKRYVLREEEDYFSNTFGIVCSKPLVELVWNINKQLSLSLQRDEDIEGSRNGIEDFWPLFFFRDESLETDYQLVQNKGLENVLAPELRNADFFLIETNHNLTFGINQKNISSVKFVDFCFPIEQNNLKPETRNLLKI